MYRLHDGYYLTLAKVRDDIDKLLSRATHPKNTHEDVSRKLRDISRELERVKNEIIADY